MAATVADYGTISVTQLHDACRQGEVDLIDVRTPAEFREVHAAFARNVPLDSLDPQRTAADRRGDAPLYVICRSGGRSTKACDALAKAGVTGLVNVEGGTAAWEAAGLPVERGQRAISLERQVRIAAGSLVLLGLAAGYFLHPIGFLLSAFVGGGLVFSGVTDTCGMGLVLARAPWNQVGSRRPSASGGESCCTR